MARREAGPAITTVLRWQDLRPGDVDGATVAVIDVLRWSTVVVTALAHGATAVDAVATAEEALARAAHLGRSRVLLGGEREARALPGHDVGNSPGEYTRERVAGRVIVTTTTNGTSALLATRPAARRVIAAFVNLAAIARELAVDRRAGRRIVLVAAGQAGEPTLEDTACAGAVAEALGPHGGWCPVTASAVDRWVSLGRDAGRAVRDSSHAATLREAGFAADLVPCAALNAYRLVPEAGNDGRVTSGRPDASQ